MEKELHIWMDNKYPKETVHDFKTLDVLLKEDKSTMIHTTNTHFCSTTYLAKGYRIFVHMLDSEVVEMRLGYIGNNPKEIRIAHNLEKMLLANAFGLACE